MLYKCYFVSSQVIYCFIKLLICTLFSLALMAHSLVETTY